MAIVVVVVIVVVQFLNFQFQFQFHFHFHFHFPLPSIQLGSAQLSLGRAHGQARPDQTQARPRLAPRLGRSVHAHPILLDQLGWRFISFGHAMPVVIFGRPHSLPQVRSTLRNRDRGRAKPSHPPPSIVMHRPRQRSTVPPTIPSVLFLSLPSRPAPFGHARPPACLANQTPGQLCTPYVS